MKSIYSISITSRLMKGLCNDAATADADNAAAVADDDDADDDDDDSEAEDC